MKVFKFDCTFAQNDEMMLSVYNMNGENRQEEKVSVHRQVSRYDNITCSESMGIFLMKELYPTVCILIPYLVV